MSKLKPSTLALLLPLFLSPILAENADLVGCNEVSCPQDGADDRCTVEDDTFLGVGVSHIPDVPSTLEGFSLVKGVNVSAGMAGKDNDKPTRPFTSVYYLGVPEEADTEDLSGCAVIFNNPPEKKFKGPELEGSENGTDTRAATGTCSDVIEQRCIDTIAQRARNITDDSNGNTCDALERELKGNSFDGCSGFGGQGNSLGNFTVRPLEDLNTVRNSSDCWPIQQKSDRLMKIADVTSHANYSSNALFEEAYKITPVLTVFTGGNDSLVDRTSSQMTCLKVVTDEDPSDDDDGSEGSAAALRGSWFAATVAVLVGIFTQL